MPHAPRILRSLTRTPLATAALIAAAFACAPHARAADKEADGPAALASHRANRVWVVGGSRNDELRFQRGPGNEPVVVLNSSAFRNREITIDIETDAAWFRITNGAVDLDLRVKPAAKYRITLNGDEHKPQLALNGKELIGQSPTWGKIINDENRPTFTLMLREATEATLKMKTRGGSVKLRDANDTEGAPPPPGSAPPAAVPVPGFTPEAPPLVPLTPEAPPAAARDDLGFAKLRKSVFTVRVPSGESGVDIVAPGFLVSHDGYAITTFTPLRGATRATASFASAAGIDIPLELIAARPDLDLALVRLDPVRAAALTGVEPLQFETAKLRADDAVRVLPPDGAAATPPAGKLVAGLLWSSVPATAARSLRFPDDTRWVQIDTPIDADLAGSPVVNDVGRVVAIAAWHWHSPQERRPEFFAFYAAAAAELAAQRPDKPLTFAAASRDLAKSPGPQLAFPTLAVTGAGSEAEVRKVAVALRAAAVCPMCKGAGKVDTQVKVGERVTGNLRRDIIDTKPEPCPRCKGAGLNDPVAVYRLSKSLAQAAARSPAVAADDEDTAIAPLRITLGELMKLNAEGFASSINTNSGVALADTESSDDMRGQAVSMIARMHTTPAVGGVSGGGDPAGDSTGGVRTLSFQTTSRVVILRSPHLSDVNPTPGAVWAGGLVAGYVHDEKGQRVPVLQSGFALSAKSSDR